MKTLFLLRHAKSDQSVTGDDHDRPLNKRGEKSCIIIGQYMNKKTYYPQLILSSDARRTQQTTSGVVEQLDSSPSVEFSPKLYLASSNDILKIVHQTNDHFNSMMIVAHNPGISQIGSDLLKQGDPYLMTKAQAGFVTASLACYQFGVESWGLIENHSGSLIDFVSPKEID